MNPLNSEYQMTTVLQCKHYFCSEGNEKLNTYPNAYVQGLTGSSDTSQLRTDFILTRHATGGERYVLYIVGPGIHEQPHIRPDSFALINVFYMVCCTAVALRFVLYVEVAVNGMFGAGQGGMINPPDPDRHCSLSLSEIAVFDQEVYDLIMDLTILYDMTKVTLAPSICMTNNYFQ